LVLFYNFVKLFRQLFFKKMATFFLLFDNFLTTLKQLFANILRSPMSFFGEFGFFF
jgi:hypothetical protein